MERADIVFCLEALRRALCKALVVVGIASLASFLFSKKLALFLIKAVHVKAYYFSLPEVFLATVELAIYTGMFLSVPLVAFIVWREFRPFLEREKIRGHLFAGFAILLFYLGSVFCLLVALPNGIAFLLSYEGGAIKAMISIKRLILFCAAMMFAFGSAFELPLVLLLLSKFGVVSARSLAKGRRYAVLIIVIVASVVTPTPDIYNMSLLAGPLYVLYECGLLLVKMRERSAARAAALS
jgi:sec-independent protein translocase protein TatC